MEYGYKNVTTLALRSGGWFLHMGCFQGFLWCLEVGNPTSQEQRNLTSEFLEELQKSDGNPDYRSALMQNERFRSVWKIRQGLTEEEILNFVVGVEVNEGKSR